MDETFETVECFFRSSHSFATTYLRPVGRVRTVQGSKDTASAARLLPFQEIHQPVQKDALVRVQERTCFVQRHKASLIDLPGSAAGSCIAWSRPGEAVDAFAALAIIDMPQRSQRPRGDARLLQSFPPRGLLQV